MEKNGETLKQYILKRAYSAFPLVILGVLVLVVIGLGAGVKEKSERIAAEKAAEIRKDQTVINVVAQHLTPGVIRDKLNLPAIVEAMVELKVLSEVRGKVVELAVKEGDHVEKGQLIALIDQRDYKNAVESAEASYDLAIKKLERVKNLFTKEIAPRSELDDAEAHVRSLKAALDGARLSLERCEIKAPVDGIVNHLDAKVGLLISPNDPVALIIDIDPVKVIVGIPESDVDAVRSLGTFTITVDALGGRKLAGRKIFLSKMPDTLAHLYRLEVEVQNPSEEILPGMFARVEVVKTVSRESITVPLYAVISRGEEHFVYVIKDGESHRRPIVTGILEGWRVQVTKGLKPGEDVIVVGHRSVGEGQKVNVIRSVNDPDDLFN